jgi:hypothetical protein
VRDSDSVLQYGHSPFAVTVYGAAEIVHIGQTVMASRDINTLKYFVSTIFNYPTMAEAYRVAAYFGGSGKSIDVPV